MKPLISILLPHLRNEYNDAALAIALSCIATNTDIGAFPDPLDMDFHMLWELNGGQFRRVRSYVYHLQNWSTEGRGVR